MKTVILASHNQHKLQELQKALHDMPFTLQLASDLPEVEETASTFIENALLKARAAAAATGMPALADDSGLVVPYLHGEPGIYSARYAGEPQDAQKNIDRVLHEMRDAPQELRSAYFYCCLVILRYASDPLPIIAEGIWHGEIIQTPNGTEGFGYDPIFWVPEKQCTAAQLPPEVKNKISHRGLAVQQLRSKLDFFK